MEWAKTAAQFLCIAIKPLRHVKSLWGWADLFVRLFIILGIFFSAGFGIAIDEARWLLTIITPSLIAILFLVAGLRLQRKLSDIEQLSNIKPGDVIENKEINISFLLERREGCFVDSVTFQKCTLRGPCLVTLKGENEFSYCSLWGSKDHSEHLILADESRKYNGIGAFVNCNFKYCRFENIAWLLNQKQYDKFLKIHKARG